MIRKKLFLICLLPALCSFSPTNSTPKPDGGKTQKDYVDYFSGYLAGDKTAYGASKKLSPKAVAKAQAAVWNSWKAANSAFTEEKLGPLQPLDKERSGSWDLTAYEPNAVMPYYYGTKGAAKPEAGWPLFLYLDRKSVV